MYNSFLKIHQNFAAALSYVLGPVSGLICFIGETVTGNNNKYVKFHALQSTIFFLAVGVIDIALGILGFLPFMGLINSIVDLATLVMWIYLMVSAFSGKEFKIPVIGDVCWNEVNK